MNNKKFKWWTWINSAYIAIGCVLAPYGLYGFLKDSEDLFAENKYWYFLAASTCLAIIYLFTRRILYYPSINKFEIKDDMVENYINKTK